MHKTTKFESWDDFKSDVLKHLFGDSPVERGRFLFRGQRSPDWELSSTFDRSFPDIKGKERNTLERDLLQHFRQECEADSRLRHLVEEEVSTLALAQHYGVPTRLLDWSESPYAAAFFAYQHAASAFESIIDIFRPDATVAVWALDSDSYVWSEAQGVQIVSPPTWENTRMRNQSGKFTLSKTPFRSLQEYVASFPDEDDALQLFLVPSEDAQLALADLDLMGINHASLFVDLRGRAKAAISKVVLGARTRNV